MNRAATNQRVRALQGEIAHTRAELGETVQELASRADVPARARQSARRAADRARTAGTSPRVWLVAATAAAAVTALVGWARWDRRQRRRRIIAGQLWRTGGGRRGPGIGMGMGMRRSRRRFGRGSRR